MIKTIRLICSMFMILALASQARQAEGKADMIEFPVKLTHPSIACTPAELARLRAAYKSEGPGHDVVAGVVQDADEALKAKLVFPPSGGQHNQWYQCTPCQMGLKKIDATHHQCPKCKKVYSGYPYDAVRYRDVHSRNLSTARKAAWAYAITGQDRYAAYARDVLTGYGRRYLEYPLQNPWLAKSEGAMKRGGHIMPQTLTEAYVLAKNIAPAYDLIYDWPGLTEADRKGIEQGLLAPMLKQISGNKADKSNWQSWHNAGLFAGAVLIGDYETARATIEDPANGFVFQMTASISEDGMWYENSWGYHFYTLGALVSHAESARRIGIDLWSHDRFGKMFTLPLDYRMADGSLPRFGDAVQNTALDRPQFTEAAYHAHKDPKLLALLPDKVLWETVLYGRDVTTPATPSAPVSRLVPGAGHAILRTGGPAGMTAAMTYGPYGGFHGHLDKLSFVVFGYERELGVDPGRAASQAYRLPIHGNWYKATLSHNTVIVDGQSQEPAEGEMLLFRAEPHYVVAAAACDQAYEGVKHRRLLCLREEYLLVVDDLTAAESRRFDWVYHNRADGVSCEAATAAGQMGENYVGAEYLKNIKIGVADGPIRVVFRGSDGATHLTAAAATGTDVRIGDGPGSSVLERIPLAVLTQRGQDASFACAIEPTKGSNAHAVADVALSRDAGGLTVTVRAGTFTDTLAWDRGDRVTVSREVR